MITTTPTPFFIERFQALYGHPFASAERPVSIRINTLKADAVEIKKELDNKKIGYLTVPWYRDALILTGTESRTVTEMQLYEDGKIYIQSLGSMVPALVLDPTAQDEVMDMAAAPGSKTSQMAAMMGNSGQIIANDIDRRRLYKLNAVLDTLGVSNVMVTSYAGQSLWQHFPERFDKVLLDAPCSMEGTLYPVSKKIKELSRLQRWLLRSAVSSAKPGGTIVYSTCSMAPEENEEVVDWILEKEKGNIAILKITLPVTGAVPGKTAWKNKTLHPSLSCTMRIPPDSGNEPFFIAFMRKTASTVRISDEYTLA